VLETVANQHDRMWMLIAQVAPLLQFNDVRSVTRVDLAGMMITRELDGVSS
jgi:hypothetical protein